MARERERAIKRGFLEWRPKKRWELEVVRMKSGTTYVRAIEVPPLPTVSSFLDTKR